MATNNAGDRDHPTDRESFPEQLGRMSGRLRQLAYRAEYRGLYGLRDQLRETAEQCDEWRDALTGDVQAERED